jgi:superfamily II DNA/RNA helicase
MLAIALRHHFCRTYPLHPSLLAVLQQRGLYPLKQFQEEALQMAEQGDNFFINSCTGSGKTLAYLVPILNSLFENSDQQPRASVQRGALILTLNKELVAQVYR